MCSIQASLPQEGVPLARLFPLLMGHRLHIFAGGHASLPAEYFGKIIGVGKAGGLRHIGHRDVLSPEQELGILNAQVGDISPGRNAGFSGEGANQMGFGHLQPLGQFVQPLQEGEFRLDNAHRSLIRGGSGPSAPSSWRAVGPLIRLVSMV